MTRPQQRLLSQLATSPNELASGLGQCLEALRLISALPRASPVLVHYTSTTPPIVKAFGREHFSRVPLRTVIALIKSSLGLPDPVRITTALFYREDGTIDPTHVLIDEDSWKELAPYVHTLHIEDEPPERPPSTARSSLLSAITTFSGTAVAAAVGNGVTPSSSPTSILNFGNGTGRGSSGLNSNATAFVPLSNGSSSSIIIKKSSEGGAKGNFQNVRKPSFSPSSPQAASPFAVLDG